MSDCGITVQNQLYLPYHNLLCTYYMYFLELSIDVQPNRSPIESGVVTVPINYASEIIFTSMHASPD